MKCKYCGCEFEQPKRGRKKDYCNKEECLRQARNEAKRKWYANKIKKELSGTKHRIINKTEEEKKPIVIYSSIDRAEHKLQMPDIGDIRQLAQEIGTARFQLIQMIEKERKSISEYDKYDQDFLHKLENLEELTDQEVINLVLEEKKNRESRRNNKVRYYLIQGLLDGITIKNPPAFVAQAIQRSKDFEYVPRTIQELKKDESLCVVKEGQLNATL